MCKKYVIAYSTQRPKWRLDLGTLASVAESLIHYANSHM